MRKILLIAVTLVISGCSTYPIENGFYRWERNSITPASHGTHQLVKTWVGKPYDKDDTWEFAARPQMCQYDNGVIMEQHGRQLCPRTL